MPRLLLLPFALLYFAVNAQRATSFTTFPYLNITCYSKKQCDAFSFSGNPAMLSYLNTRQFGVFGERRFMLAETSAYCGVAAIPTKLGNIGLQINYEGFSAFNQSKIGFAYGKLLGKNVSIGAQFDYLANVVSGYGHASAFTFEAGAAFQITENIRAGAYTFSPIPAFLNQDRIAGIYKIGASYDVSENFLVTVDVMKEDQLPAGILAGLQYQFAKQFFARAGVRTENSMLFFGAGWSFHSMRIDVTTSYHSRLGFSPGLMLVTQANKKE